MTDYRSVAAEAEIGADREKIRKNALLEEIYVDVYDRILDAIPRREFPRVLEIGSGGGFFQTCAPYLVTSDCVAGEGIDRVVDACKLHNYFQSRELDAIVAFNVFHHLPDVTGFLRGASDVLRPGGRVVLVEPWFTPLGQWFYRGLHHEPSLLDPNDWSVAGEGRLLGANSRLPTSVFRDSPARFAKEFPNLRVVECSPFHKWLYLMSGGLRLNTRVPRALARSLVALDRKVRAGDEATGLFARIVVERA
ncbi:MAG: methyltransferase domain-containing protein [Polyangiaceae bacterium]